MRTSSVTDAKLRSPLTEANALMQLTGNGRGRRSKKKIVVTLVLTSLVDAFCIILLYLLVQNSGTNSTLELQRADRLPMASKIEALHEGTLVRVERGQYFIGTLPVSQHQLAAQLQAIKARLGDSADNSSLIIQADRTSDFSALVPVIRAGSITGFNKFKFAVLQAEGQEKSRL